MQKFKGKELIEAKIVKKILSFYNVAETEEILNGLNWYADAHRFASQLSDKFGQPIERVAGLIAAFSPQTSWNVNKMFVVEFLKKGGVVSNFDRTQKARKIMKLDSVNDIHAALSVNGGALKTKAFFLNILQPDKLTGATIDRHAVAVCLQSVGRTKPMQDVQMTAAQYRFFEGCYIKAANKLGILPQQLQAVTWVVYRRLRELAEHNDVPF